MSADQNFYDICFTFFYPTASAAVYSRRPNFFRAKHSATDEGENWAYGPTLSNLNVKNWNHSKYRWIDFVTDHETTYTIVLR